MLGDALLVAPVVEQGAQQRVVYLPRGPSAWLDFHTRLRFTAGTSHTLEATLATLPLFVPEGARFAWPAQSP